VDVAQARDLVLQEKHVVAGVSTAPARSRGLRIDAGDRVRVAVIGALLVFVFVGLPPLLSAYWIDVSTSVAIYSVVALGLNLLIGRVGMVSLGQIAVLALGAWIGARFLFGTGLPFPVVLLIDGLLTMVLGTLIGLPALRLSGLYLALITLMLAGAISVVLNATNFPNGGGGFKGYTDTLQGSANVRRPDIATSDPAYYRYTLVCMVLMFGLALWHVRSKPGRAWAAIRQSEPAALAAGVNITLYKLWAFALAAFMTGVAGALLAAHVNHLYTFQFRAVDSILLLAVVLMGGIYSLWGAIVAGAFVKLLPALLDNWGLPADLLTILFGVGILQVLLTAPGGVAQQFPRDMARLGGAIARLFRRGEPAGEAAK
jgi:branched-chain amino acid transport system permease protein